MKMLLLLIFISLSCTAVAGDRVGNGGDVIVCGDKVELLDLYEARVRGFKPLKPTSQNHEDMLREVLDLRLARLQPQRASRYREYGQEFFRESLILPGIELSDVADAGLAVIPRGCKLEQIVVQLADGDIIPGANRYTISQDLWDKLDEFNKMALMLHEVIYREAITKNVGTSMTVRAMVGQLLRDEMDTVLFLRLTQTFSRRNNLELELYSYFLKSERSMTITRLSSEVYRLESDSLKDLKICITPDNFQDCRSKKSVDVSPLGYVSDSGRGVLVPAGEIIEFQKVRVKLSVSSHVEIDTIYMDESVFRIRSATIGEGTFEVFGATVPISFSMRNFQGLYGNSNNRGISINGRYDFVKGFLGPIKLPAFSFSSLWIGDYGSRISGSENFVMNAGGREFSVKGVSLTGQDVNFIGATLLGDGPLPMQIFERFTVPVRSTVSDQFNVHYDLTFNLDDFAGTFKFTVLEVTSDVVLRPAGGRNRPALILQRGLYEFSRGTDEVMFKAYRPDSDRRRSFKIYRDGRIE